LTLSFLIFYIINFNTSLEIAQIERNSRKEKKYRYGDLDLLKKIK